MYYLIKLDLFNFFKILSGNVALFSSKIFKLENKKINILICSEFFSLQLEVLKKYVKNWHLTSQNLEIK